MAFVKFCDVSFLSGDEVLKFLDPVHGFGTFVVIDLGVFFHPLEPENFVSQGIVVFLVTDRFDKLFL
ncbi:MAG: hypothetical protein AB2L21_01955 [Anaerolineaceae bacterium]